MIRVKEQRQGSRPSLRSSPAQFCQKFALPSLYWLKYLVTLLCQMWAGFDEPGKLLLIIGRLMSSPPVWNNFPNYQVSLRGTTAIIIINGNNCSCTLGGGWVGEGGTKCDASRLRKSL